MNQVSSASPETEEWRQVPSLPWIEASSLGRVRAAYDTPMPRGGTRRHSVEPTFGYEVGASSNAKARRMIVRTRGKTLKVHRLMCEAFHGPAPAQQQFVLHGDEDGTNNRSGNLKWGTQRENLNAPKFLAYCTSRTGENNPYIKGRSSQSRLSH